jgi:cell wall-associated NlpC family hydrolase
MPPTRERRVPIRFLKRAAVVVCLWCSASSLAQEVAPAPFEGVPSLLGKAKEYIGVPYRPGGFSPSGFDCSGFVRFVFRAFGVELNRSSRSQATQGEKVAPGEIQPGDLLFFRIRGNRIGHVGIYLGGGQFIHAGSRGGPSVRGVKIARLDSSYYARRLVSARRVMTAGAGPDGTPEPAPVEAVPETGSLHEAGTIE